MAICLEKKESIKSATMRLYQLMKAWRDDGRIDDQAFQLARLELIKIERCTNLEKSYDL